MYRDHLKTILSSGAVITAACLSLLFSGQALALAREEGPVHAEEWALPDLPAARTEDGQTALLQSYIDSQLFGETLLFGTMAGDRLEGLDGLIYDYLRERIREVAGGTRFDTEFEIPLSYLGLEDVWYSAEDLGVSVIWDEGGFQEGSYEKTLEKVSHDRDGIIQALLYDCPYDLYWFDKAIWARESPFQTDVRMMDGEMKVGFSRGPVFRFTVAGEYAADTYAVDPGTTGAVKTALANIKSIVERYASLSDYEKLVGYKNEICSLTSYNKAALEGLPYGNPWQLIWVFDGDADTNVVCEGYAKAFQYLFDLSGFSPNLTCISVEGVMATPTGGGKHMWNVVGVEDANYLVDVTNCDEGSVGADDKLFMVGYDHLEEDWYGYDCGKGTVYYYYDSDRVDVFDPASLAVCKAGTMKALGLTVTRQSTAGYGVFCGFTGSAARVRFGTWTDTGGQDDLHWVQGTVSGNTATCSISVADHGNQYDRYITDLYADDPNGGSHFLGRLRVRIENDPPVVSDVNLVLDEEGYTVTCSVSDGAGSGIDRVQFPTWTAFRGQDDLFSNYRTNPAASGSIQNGVVTYRVNRSDHNNEYERYKTNILAIDKCGNELTFPVTSVRIKPRLDMVLPGNLKEIKEEAFLGSLFSKVFLPDGVESIGNRAFGDCGRLEYIRIPASVVDIAGDAFEGSGSAVIYCAEDSYAESYAIGHGMRYVSE